ncbi:MAG: hypothetical protein IJJ76_11280 [Ruminococcus sp.]|uniref:hypothetical protein n=2 Tax=Ruminococcus sp. TaxID=41978 RepID=UPI0025DE6BB0|nr:hypothetical protein [Ruminococcus sp.]MBR0530327.1 hypothetical protein [Ruminococcus sp.]
MKEAVMGRVPVRKEYIMKAKRVIMVLRILAALLLITGITKVFGAGAVSTVCLCSGIGLVVLSNWIYRFNS